MIVYLHCQVRVEYFQWHLSREGVTSESGAALLSNSCIPVPRKVEMRFLADTASRNGSFFIHSAI